jgi:hypothetical protein
MPPQANARTVASYLRSLSDDRRKPMTTLRKVIRDNLPTGFREVIGYGMPGWVVPHSLYPDGYHCDPTLPLPFMSIASLKGHIGVYHMGLYADPKLMAWFQQAYARQVPAKLDMGKSCIRFKKPEAIPFELIGTLAGKLTPKAWIVLYEKHLKA